MTDRPSFEAPIDPAAGIRPPTNEEAQRAAEVLADNIRGDQLSTDGFLFVRADQAVSAMLAYAASEQVDTHQYAVGDLTFKHVFQAAKLVNMSDMQAVLDAVEAALARAEAK
ncbi:hypothetical protein [Sphingomonas sp. Ant20]|uniref:hypothetical protein n=1 Tax=Sphingomonas sp. Ant20 TaxID=104605 RepID=UPI00053728A5|nr:hypothetical protein [Sphingomonas sp. Ant20]KHA63580.1 hypothetical protein NI18_15030 [Sphingomonas sp. Ant20]